jgi:hypothetical protein
VMASPRFAAGGCGELCDSRARCRRQPVCSAAVATTWQVCPTRVHCSGLRRTASFAANDGWSVTWRRPQTPMARAHSRETADGGIRDSLQPVLSEHGNHVEGFCPEAVHRPVVVGMMRGPRVGDWPPTPRAAGGE